MTDSSGPRFVHAPEVESLAVKSQVHGSGDDAVTCSVWLKFLELRPDLAIFHTQYDPGLRLQRHGHKSEHFIFVIAGEVTFDDELCTHGSLIHLPKGAAFGPIHVGSEGAEILELYLGDSRPEPADPEGWEQLKADNDITELPRVALPVPDWFGDRTD